MIKENYRSALNKRREKIQPISTETLQQILRLGDTDTELGFLRDVVRIVANTGLMNCELQPLKISDVDPANRWLAVGRTRACTYAKRILPIRQKTLESIISLHRMHPGSQLILGDAPRNQITRVIEVLRPRFPEVARGRLFMYSIRMNFLLRLICAGVPRSVGMYWLGHHDLMHMMPSRALSSDQKLQIVRRNIENFMIEL